jgi:hypothetical protein
MIIAAGVVFALTVVILIVVLLLRRQLREKYAILWLLIGTAILVLSVFPSMLVSLSTFLGVAVPSNLIFSLAIVLLVGVTLHLSWELSQAEGEIRRIAEEVAILRTGVERIQTNISSIGNENDSNRSGSDDAA